jgi:hypothetical protein
MNEPQAQLAAKPNPGLGGHMPGTDSFLELTALVPKDIADLLAAFLPNRRADVAQLRAALAEEDWARVRAIAERMYALGNPYGFRQITTLGRLMRTACAQRDAVELQRLTGAYAQYLASVIVVVVETSLFPDRKKHPAPA